jgi:hypothetical protein
MGFDFGDRWRVKRDLEQVATVTSGHNSIEADPINQLFGFGYGVKAGVRLKSGFYLTCLIHHHQFDGARADVYSGKTHLYLLSFALA